MTIDLTKEVRQFISAIDFEVVDLGYDVKAILEKYCSTKYPPTESPNTLAEFAEELMREGSVKEWEDALVVADYVLNTLYPSIRKCVRMLGYHGAMIHSGNIEITTRNRKVHCMVIMMVV